MWRGRRDRGAKQECNIVDRTRVAGWGKVLRSKGVWMQLSERVYVCGKVKRIGRLMLNDCLSS